MSHWRGLCLVFGRGAGLGEAVFGRGPAGVPYLGPADGQWGVSSSAFAWVGGVSTSSLTRWALS